MRYMFATIIFFCTSSLSHAQSFPTVGDKPTPRFLIENFNIQLGVADEAAARPLIPTALELIKDFEGWIAAAYNDPAGFCTIGYGHLIALNRCENINLGEFGNPLTEEQGSDLLLSDSIGARLAVQRLVEVDLNDAQFGALVSFVFNVGGENFRRSTLRRLLNDGEYELASEQFPRWVRANNIILSGLVNRRACEMALFDGQLDTSSGTFRRSDCLSLSAAPSSGSLIDIQVGE